MPVVPQISLLGQEDKELLHRRSLEILEEGGIQFNSDKALDILEQAGCRVDREDKSAKIPAELVEKALKTLPSQFVKAARGPAQDILCGGGDLFYTTTAMPGWIRDLDTRERRLATSDDLIRCARLTDAMDELSEWCPMVDPSDVPPLMRGIRSAQISYLHTTKHILSAVHQKEETPFFLEMVDAVLGDRERLRERPILTQLIEPTSPLTNDGNLIDNLLEWAPFRPPIYMQVLPLAGATSPITLAGSVLQENTSFLGNMVLYQTAEPGWPIVWGTAGGMLDMRSGQYVGGPEAMLMTLSLIEMAKFHGVPCSTFGSSSSEAKGIGFQTGMESMFGHMVCALAGVDNICWPTDLDGFALMDLAHMVLSTEAARQAARFRKGISLDEEHLMKDLILQMKFQGEYLSDPSTKKYFRKEHLMADLFPRETYEQWEARGKSEEEMGIERVKRILAGLEPKSEAPEVAKGLDRICEAAEKVLLR